MCKYWSCLITKGAKVLWLEGVDNHHELVGHFGLKDNTTNQEELKFARVEVTPPNGIPFYPINQWTFKLDERIRPEWFSPAHEAACLKVLEKEVWPLAQVSFLGHLYLENYKFLLPKSFTHCGGSLYLGDYSSPLPESFTHCGGDLYLGNYSFPLPKSFTHCGGHLYLWDYSFPLPESFTHCGGSLYLGNFPLPKSFTHCGGDLYPWDYSFPLPKSLKEVK